VTRRALPIAWSLPIAALALACAGCGAPRDRFAGLPREQIDFVFGPWPNGMRMPPEERYRPDLALVALLDTGELFLRLPRGARGQAWCHITVPGRKPLLLWGDVEAVGHQLRSGPLRFRPLEAPELGIVTGVTWHASGDPTRLCHQTEPSTTMAFTDEIGRKTLCRADDRGVYRAALAPGIYRLTATWLAAGRGEDSRALGRVTVEAGHTTVIDVRLTSAPSPRARQHAWRQGGGPDARCSILDARTGE